MSIYFAVLVFGKIVFYAGPLQPGHCQAMLDTYQPPILDHIIVADGRIVKPSDYRPWCLVTPVEPDLGSFFYGDPT